MLYEFVGLFRCTNRECSVNWDQDDDKRPVAGNGLMITGMHPHGFRVMCLFHQAVGIGTFQFR